MELVQIGDQKIPVVAQRHARLRHLLKAEDFQKILTKDYAQEAYRILSILIPALPAAIPEYEWEGFTSEEAWKRYEEGDRSAYIEDQDHSPTPMEIVQCFETALMVNGASRLGKVLGLVQSGATLVGAQQTESLPDSLGANGVSALASTGAQSPT